jgi:hypothetical protein
MPPLLFSLLFSNLVLCFEFLQFTVSDLLQTFKALPVQRDTGPIDNGRGSRQALLGFLVLCVSQHAEPSGFSSCPRESIQSGTSRCDHTIRNSLFEGDPKLLLSVIGLIY